VFAAGEAGFEVFTVGESESGKDGIMVGEERGGDNFGLEGGFGRFGIGEDAVWMGIVDPFFVYDEVDGLVGVAIAIGVSKGEIGFDKEVLGERGHVFGKGVEIAGD